MASVEPRLLLLLIDLAPQVWVAGSWARGTNHPGSDLDLVPRPNPDYDPNSWSGPTSNETLMAEVIETLDRHCVGWTSQTIGHLEVEAVGGLPIEVFDRFATWTPDQPAPTTHEVMVSGVVMEALDPAYLAATPWDFAHEHKRRRWEQR